jgi:hypothetical protein
MKRSLPAVCPSYGEAALDTPRRLYVRRRSSGRLQAIVVRRSYRLIAGTGTSMRRLSRGALT